MSNNYTLISLVMTQKSLEHFRSLPFQYNWFRLNGLAQPGWSLPLQIQHCMANTSISYKEFKFIKCYTVFHHSRQLQSVMLVLEFTHLVELKLSRSEQWMRLPWTHDVSFSPILEYFYCCTAKRLGSLWTRLL